MDTEYKTLRELGRGAAGVVRLVMRKRDKRKFAAKEINFAELTRTAGSAAVQRDVLMREARLMRDLPYQPSIVALEEVINVRDGLILVMEYVDGGSLQELVYPQGAPGARTAAKLIQHFDGGGGAAYSPAEGGDEFGDDTWGDGGAGPSPSAEDAEAVFRATAPEPFPEAKITTWLLHLCNALKFLHASGIVHRDIKLQNILVTKETQLVKIADFGVAENLIVNGREGNAKTTVGTPMYMSPEVCDSAPYNTQSDMWSLGVVAFELCCRRPPFAGGNMLALVDAVSNHPVGRIDNVYSDELDVIVRSMLTKDPAARPTAATLEKMLSMKRRHCTAEELCAFAGLKRAELASAPFISREGFDGGGGGGTDGGALPGAVPLASVNRNAPHHHQKPQTPAAGQAPPPPRARGGGGAGGGGDQQQQHSIMTTAMETSADVSKAEREDIYAEARRAAAANRRKFEASLLGHQHGAGAAAPPPEVPVSPPGDSASPSGRHRDANSPIPPSAGAAATAPKDDGGAQPRPASASGAGRRSLTTTGSAASTAEFEAGRFQLEYEAEMARQQAVMGALFPDTPRDAPQADHARGAAAAAAAQQQHHHHVFDDSTPTGKGGEAPESPPRAAPAAGHDDTLDSVLVATPAPAGHRRGHSSTYGSPAPRGDADSYHHGTAPTTTAAAGRAQQQQQQQQAALDAVTLSVDEVTPTTSVGGNPAARIRSAGRQRHHHHHHHQPPSTAAVAAPADGGQTPPIPAIPLPSARLMAHNPSQGRPPRGTNPIACRNCRDGGAEATIASVYCDDCRAALCASCALVIHQHRVFAEHAMAPLSLGVGGGSSVTAASSLQTTAATADGTIATQKHKRKAQRAASSSSSDSGSSSSSTPSSASSGGGGDDEGAAVADSHVRRDTQRGGRGGAPSPPRRREVACDTASLVAAAEQRRKVQHNDDDGSGCCAVM